MLNSPTSGQRFEPANQPLHAIGDEKNGNLAWRWYAVAAVLIGLDQLTKQYFASHLDLYQSVSVVEPVLNFTLAHNLGAAFSLLADKGGWQKWLFAALAGLVSVGILYYLRQVSRRAVWLSLGLAFILAGALGNFIDRLRLGYVIDFIHVHYADSWHFPIFNVADIAINLGVALIVLDMLFFERRRSSL